MQIKAKFANSTCEDVQLLARLIINHKFAGLLSSDAQIANGLAVIKKLINCLEAIYETLRQV